MSEAERRPSPDALLRQAQKEGHGRLKLFFGAAPGVGKTYAMLRAAQRRKVENIDVCVGLIETHGRPETAAQMQGLEVLPRKIIDYRGRDFHELDVDAIIARRPQLVLVDELAHSNAPGSRYAKRYQDVEDLLAAGIDVYSTMNVQHVESLNDVVTRITGVAVSETVPDEVVARADELELIDLPPGDLIQRLKEGKVYVPEQARRALQQFFSPATLTALRELAMRLAAEHVDAQLVAFKQAHGVAEVWPTRERILVCVSEADISQAVLRAARRIAENRRIPWLAVHIETPRTRNLPPESKERVARNLQLAERLGAQIIRIEGDDPVHEILACARRENVTQIVVGRARSRWLTWRGTLAQRLIAAAAPLEVTVVTWEQVRARQPLKLPPIALPHLGRHGMLVAVGIGIALTAALIAAGGSLSLDGKAMFYLLATALVATRYGLWPAIFAASLNFVLLNFFFSPPLYRLTVASGADVRSLLSFFVVALLTGNLSGKLHDRLEAQRASNRRTENMMALAEKLAGASALRDVVSAVAAHLYRELWPETVVMLPDDSGRLIVQAGSTEKRPLKPADQAAAHWAFAKGQRAGWGTDTLPAATWLFVPLTTGSGRLGVLGVRSPAGRQFPTDAEVEHFEAVADLAAVAVERTQLVTKLESARLVLETDSLRTALLSSVSHDLRTPLSTILGAADSLLREDVRLGIDARHELLEAIVDEAERLDRCVQNLLDMTRLNNSGMQLRRDWCDLREVIGRARQRLSRTLESRAIELVIPHSPPLLWADPLLLEQVLVNLLDNAAKYSPPATPIRIETEVARGRVVLRVVDRGAGIPSADREAVFSMFYRVHATDSRVSGTGLGLAICRGFIEAHGGSIVAREGPGGVGTTIEITLPLSGHVPRSAGDVKAA